jgi:hypothetical protein
MDFYKVLKAGLGFFKVNLVAHFFAEGQLGRNFTITIPKSVFKVAFLINSNK